MNPFNFLNFNSQNFIPNLVISIIVICLILLLLREARTWYWKQNEIVSLLKKIEENTRKPISESIQKNEVRVVEETKPFQIKNNIDFDKLHSGLKTAGVILFIVGIIIIFLAKMSTFMSIGRF